MANILSFDKQIQCIAALTEGVSIRATERLTGVHRDTVMRLGVRVGGGCKRLHDEMFQQLHIPVIELDELWSFVGKKQRRLTEGDGPDKGDQYIFTALDVTSKALFSYRIGKRDGDTTRAFIWDVRDRVTNAPQISSDAFTHYERAIREAFEGSGSYGQIIKRYAGEPPTNTARRYSPGVVVGVNRRQMFGSHSGRIGTSYIERSNLTLRMQSRRLTRLTNGFSKKLENHKAAFSLLVAHYNLCRVHETLRITPAMQLGLTDHVWDIAELIDVATELGSRPIPRRGRFEVIEGGAK